jgi:hypothetical protein
VCVFVCVCVCENDGAAARCLRPGSWVCAHTCGNGVRIVSRQQHWWRHPLPRPVSLANTACGGLSANHQELQGAACARGPPGLCSRLSCCCWLRGTAAAARRACRQAPCHACLNTCTEPAWHACVYISISSLVFVAVVPHASAPSHSSTAHPQQRSTSIAHAHTLY